MDDQHNRYLIWIEQNEPSGAELQAQRETVLPGGVKFSIVITVTETVDSFLAHAIESVIGQTYANWELIVICSERLCERVGAEVDALDVDRDRIKTDFIADGEPLAAALNKGLEVSAGAYAAFLDRRDTLAPFALFEVARALDKDLSDIVYSDEDCITWDGEIRFDPDFKPDFGPDTLRSRNYLRRLLVLRKGLTEDIGGYRTGFEGGEHYDLVLRAVENTTAIAHIPKVLYHKRVQPSIAEYRAPRCPGAERAIKAHLERTGLGGKVEEVHVPGLFRVTLGVKDDPKVSIIIPNHDNHKDLRRCVESIFDRSTYRNIEVLIVENNSTEDETFKLYEELKKIGHLRVLEWKRPFNYSAINNYAASQATGDIFLFLNNDTEVLNPDWLERMIEHAQRINVGVVGAKLYYPFGTIQHGGIVVGMFGVVGHAHRFFHKESDGYYGRLKAVHNLSAVTGACLMARKDVFEEVGGFDEKFTIAGSDIDICLKAREQGLLVVFTPLSELCHYELRTRGTEDTPQKIERWKAEVSRLRSKWTEIFENGDPYYSPNLTLNSEDFSIKLVDDVPDINLWVTKKGELIELIKELEKQNKEKGQRLASIEHQVHGLLDSASWKVTAPLRKILDYINNNK